MGESAVDQLAEIGARELRATTRRLLHRQRMLEAGLEYMAQQWHKHHCRHTNAIDYRDCHYAVCERNRKLTAERVFVNEPEATLR